MALEEKVFAVVDLETTGFKADQDSIFEIGIIYFKNGEIIEEYHQLIHPEKTIPNAIIQLTKIKPSALQEAPSFETIAKSLHSKLKDCIIVAHQISFDFSFLKNAFEKQGLAFHPKKLCTLKLAKHLFPELPNHKLNTINEFLQLGFKDLHQAHPDALIALEILKLGIQRDPEYLLEAIRFDRQQLFPPKIEKKLLFELPTDAGVYFFHDDRGKILYIGKAKNIQKRVLNHFDQGSDSQQKQSMIQQIADIKVEETHGELLALLKENQYIKKNWPPYNAAQKQGAKRFDLIGIENRGGELNLELVKKAPISLP
ncbi:exonuclease domain-containing protein [Persicobacter diffluens]|uniref:GIY-YIG domain-containing protein n=1 Tax=Persicobacter diffluens TaxID=981 RepID=A0AAN4W3D8_9BACT|nr:hypothetical protein PEDI_40790 [Persicobacter diffluens]